MFSRNAINNGLFMGVVFIISSYSIYMADTQGFIKAKSWILFIPFLILLFKTGTDARRKNKGIIKFGAAFKEMYSAAAIGTLLCTTFEYIMFNYIDPQLKVIMKKLSIESSESLKSVFGENISKGLVNQIKNEEFFSLGYSLSQYFVRLIVPCLIFSLFMALLIRREKPLLNNLNSNK